MITLTCEKHPADMRAPQTAAPPYAAQTLGVRLTKEQRSVTWGDEPSANKARRPLIRFRQPVQIAPSHSGQLTAENGPT